MTTKVYPTEEEHHESLQRDESFLLGDDREPFAVRKSDRSYSAARSNSGGSARKGDTSELIGVRFQDIQGFHMDENKAKYERQFCHIPKAHKGGYLPGFALNEEGNLATCFSGKLAYYTMEFLTTGEAGDDAFWHRIPQNHKKTTMRAVCFGHRVVAFGGYDGSMVVFDLTGSELWRREEVCNGEVRALGISCPRQRGHSDSDVLCAAGADGSIAFFDEDGRAFCKPIRNAHRDSAIVHAVFNDDGNKLATSASDGSIIVRVKTGSAGQWEDEWHDWDTHNRRKVFAMIFSDPKHLVSGGDDGSIVFHKSYGEEKAGRTLRDVFGPKIGVRALALTPHAQTLAAAGKNGVIAIFKLDANTNATLWRRITDCHIGGKRMCLVFTDVNRLVSASSAGTYCVHTVSGAEIKEDFRKQVVSRGEEGVPINSIISMCHGSYKGIATAGRDGSIKFFDYHGSESRAPLEAVHDGAGIEEIAWLPLLSDNQNDQQRFGSITSSVKDSLYSPRQQPSLVAELSSSIYGLRGFLASAGEKGSVKVHLLDGTKQSIVWKNDPQSEGLKLKRVYGVAIVNKRGPRLAYCGDGGAVAVVSRFHEDQIPREWNNTNQMRDFQEDQVAKGRPRPLLRPMRAVCFSADQRVACSCEDGFIRVYGEDQKKADHFELLWKAGISEQGSAAFSLAFSPVNGYLAVAGNNGAIHIFGPHGESIRTIADRKGKLRAVRFANDGCMAVTGNNGSIVLYGQSGEEIWSADDIHKGFRVYGLTFIAGNSGHVATAGDDGSINIFSPFRNQVGFRSDAHEHKKVLGLACSHKGTLASGGSSGDIIVENTKAQTMRKIEGPHKPIGGGSPTSDSSSKSRQQIRALAFQRGPGGTELLASSGEDGTICIFEVPTAGDITLLHKFDNDVGIFDRYVLALAFPHKGPEHDDRRSDDRLAAGLKDGLIEIFKVNPTQKEYKRISRIDMVGYVTEKHQFDPKRPHFPCSSVLRLSFSHDGEHLCASNGRGLVVVIIFDENSDIGGSHTLYTPHGNSGLISVAFSPEDYLLATGGFDGSVALWGPSFRDGWSADVLKPDSGITGLRIRSCDVDGIMEIARVQGAHYNDKVRDVKFTATGLLVTAGANVVHLWQRPLERIGMFPFDETVYLLSVGLHGWRPWDVAISIGLKGGQVKMFSPNEFPLSLCLKAVASLLRDNKKTEALLKYHPRILAQPLPKERCSLIHFCMMQKNDSSRTAFDTVHKLCALCITNKIWGGLDSSKSCETGESTNLLHIALRQAEWTRDTAMVELMLSYASRLPEWCTDCKEWTAAVLECITSFPMHSLGLVDFLDSRIVPLKPQIQKGGFRIEDHPSTADFHNSWSKLHVTHETSSSLSKEELKKTIAPEGCEKLDMRVLLLPGFAESSDSKQALLNVIPVISTNIITSKALQALIMHKWNKFGFRANCEGFIVHFMEIAAYSMLAVVSARAAGREDQEVELDKSQDLCLRIIIAPALAVWVLCIMVGYRSLWRTKPDVVANGVFMLAQVFGSICITFEIMPSLLVVPLLGLTVTRWEITTLLRAWQWHVGVPLPVSAREEGGWQGIKYAALTAHRRAVHGRFRWLIQYFSSYWNWLDMSLIIFKIGVPICVFWFGLSLHRAVKLYAVLLGLLVGKSLYYLRALPFIGHFTSMIWEVWGSTVWFIGVMVIILVALAFAWTVLALAHPDAHFLQEEDTNKCEPDGQGGFDCGSQAQPFGHVFAVFAASFFTMYRLVFVGDFQGDAFALSDWSAIPEDEPKMGTVFPAWIVFMLGTMFFLIIALNLLIAIINDRYRELMDQSYVRFWRERAMISIEAEMFGIKKKVSERSSLTMAPSPSANQWPRNPPKYLMFSYPGKHSVSKTLDDKSVNKVARDVHGTSAYQDENEEEGLNRRMDKMGKNISTMQLSIQSLSRQMKGLSADIRGSGDSCWRPSSDVAKEQMAQCLSRMQMCIESFGEQIKCASADSSSATGFTPMTESAAGLTPLTEATNARDASDVQVFRDLMAFHADNFPAENARALPQQQQLPLQQDLVRQRSEQTQLQDLLHQRSEQPQLQRLQPQLLMDQMQQLVMEMHRVQQMQDVPFPAHQARAVYRSRTEVSLKLAKTSSGLQEKDGLDNEAFPVPPERGDPCCRRTYVAEDRPPSRHGYDVLSMSGSRRKLSSAAFGLQASREEPSEPPAELSRPKTGHGRPPSPHDEAQVLGINDGRRTPFVDLSSGTRSTLVEEGTSMSQDLGLRPPNPSHVAPQDPAAAPLSVLPAEQKVAATQAAPPAPSPAPPPPPPTSTDPELLPVEAPPPATPRPEPATSAARAAQVGASAAAEAAAPALEFRAADRVDRRRPSKSGSGLSMKSAMSMMAAESATSIAAKQAAPMSPTGPTSAPSDVQEGAEGLQRDESCLDIS